MNLSSPKLLLVTATLLAGNVVSLAETPREKAWRILRTGAAEKNAEVRAIAVGSLGLLPHSRRAAALAENALEDEKPEVRAAGARVLGQILYAPSIPKLQRTLADKESSVALAAAQSLIQLKDPGGYDIYYSVLTGERKGGKKLISQQMDNLRDPKKAAEFSLEHGIGFLPFGGYALSAVKFIRSAEQDELAARAVAAKFLASDPDPQSGEALIQAVSNKSWLVREAALEAIAKRGDPSLLERIQAAMSDQNDRVRYTAAATVVRLTDIRLTKKTEK